jgi:hypothetical protein
MTVKRGVWGAAEDGRMRGTTLDSKPTSEQ